MSDIAETRHLGIDTEPPVSLLAAITILLITLILIAAASPVLAWSVMGVLVGTVAGAAKVRGER